MKRRLSLLWCLSILILFSGCSKANIALSQPDASSISTLESSTEESRSSETDIKTESVESTESSSPQQSLLEDAQGPVPDFLNEEQQGLYRKAKTAYMEFDLFNGGFESETGGEPELEQDGMQYYQCNGTITKWSDFEAAMLSVFTTEYFEELNNKASYTDDNGVFHKRTIFAEHNGDLYYSGGARGGNIAFVEPETFELESQGDNEIQFYVVGTYDDFAYDEDDNLMIGKDGDYQRAGNPTQEKYLITMKKGSDGWRFSEFNLAY